MMPARALPPEPIVIASRPTIRSALNHLYEAHVFARESACPDVEFAVGLSSLICGGSSAPAIRWLMVTGHVRHLVGPDRSGRTAPATSDLPITERSYFLLTDLGLALARGSGPCPPAGSVRTPGVLPRWDGSLRELWVGGQMAKRFAAPAHNQTLILDALEEDGWPPYIDDPLPGAEQIERQKRLRDAIRRLNDQKPRLLRFRANGTGEGICWELQQHDDLRE
jgi:hypothetical protein